MGCVKLVLLAPPPPPVPRQSYSGWFLRDFHVDTFPIAASKCELPRMLPIDFDPYIGDVNRLPSTYPVNKPHQPFLVREFLRIASSLRSRFAFNFVASRSLSWKYIRMMDWHTNSNPFCAAGLSGNVMGRRLCFTTASDFDSVPVPKFVVDERQCHKWSYKHDDGTRRILQSKPFTNPNCSTRQIWKHPNS